MVPGTDDVDDAGQSDGLADPDFRQPDVLLRVCRRPPRDSCLATHCAGGRRGMWIFHFALSVSGRVAGLRNTRRATGQSCRKRRAESFRRKTGALSLKYFYALRNGETGVPAGQVLRLVPD